MSRKTALCLPTKISIISGLAFHLSVRRGTVGRAGGPGPYRSLKNQIQGVIIDLNLNSQTWDLVNAASRASLGITIFSYIFIFSIVSTMFICFFSLMASMYTNIFEQSKEIALMKTLGLSNFLIYKIYIYEAFLIVFVSSFLGIGIGVFIGYTLILQQILFAQMPLPFVFPFDLLSITFGLSILFSILSSWRPLSKLLKRNLVDLLRE